MTRGRVQCDTDAAADCGQTVAVDISHAQANPSPLRIIALFIGLSEAIAGGAAVATGGAPRMIFAIFAVCFPLVVLGVFIWILLEHPANLYSPGQYTSQTTIESYARTLSRQRRDESLVFQRAISEASTAMAEAAQEGAPTPDALRERVETIFEHAVEEGTLTIDRSKLIEGAEPIQLPVSSHTTVQELLDSVYFSIASAVKPFTYNKSWILADESLTPLTEMGTRWAKRKAAMSADHRKIADIGIKPAATLSVLPWS